MNATLRLQNATVQTRGPAVPDGSGKGSLDVHLHGVQLPALQQHVGQVVVPGDATVAICVDLK